MNAITNDAATRHPATGQVRTPAQPRTKGLVIGRFAGAPIVLAPSWFLAALLITWTFSQTVRRQAPSLSLAAGYGVAFGFALLLALSVFLHEAAHALVAHRQGQQVHELAVTLWGGHTLHASQNDKPGAQALRAIVGPLTNLILAGLFYWGYTLAMRPLAHPMTEAELAGATRSVIVALLLFAAFASNAFVGVFNLLPGLPMDGGLVLEALVWKLTGWRTRGTVVAGWVGRLVALGLVVWSVIWPLVQGRSTSTTWMLWSLMIAGFLWQGSSASIHNAQLNERLAAISARSLAIRSIPLPHTASISDAQTALRNAGDTHVIPALLGADGQPVGWVDADALGRVPAAAAGRTSLTAAVVPFAAGSAVPLGLAGRPLLQHVGATSGGARLLPILDDDGKIAGILDVSHLTTEISNLKKRR